MADVYWLRDVGVASTLQSVRFILWRSEGGHGNDWDAFGLIVLLEQKGSVESGDVRQLNIHQDQISCSLRARLIPSQPYWTLQDFVALRG
jgi:hypothetical protein